MDRLFLDANVLFSAAYREESGVATLWKVDGVLLATSVFALEEARRNLPAGDRRDRLTRLSSELEIVATTTLPPSIREGLRLPEKDWPIVAGAVSAQATHLITGDFRHFGPYLGERLCGVLVLPPAIYIRSRSTPPGS